VHRDADRHGALIQTGLPPRRGANGRDGVPPLLVLGDSCGRQLVAPASPRVLIVPGLGGSGPDHWQTVWQARLPGCARVAQRDWDRPDRELWLQGLRAAIEAADGSVVLVAHSLGCALVAHAVARWRTLVARAVRGALLVAPADVDAPDRTPPETRRFAPMPTARLPFPATVIASVDDPYVAIARAREFARAWDAAFIDAGAIGHINAASGLGDWPAGRRALDSLFARHGTLGHPKQSGPAHPKV